MEGEGATSTRLEKAFAGKMVMIGYVLKRADRWALPVQLIDIDPERSDGLGRVEPAGRHDAPSGASQPPRERAAPADGRGACGGRSAFWPRGSCSSISASPLRSGSSVALTAAIAGTGLYAIRAHQLLVPVASLVFTLWAGFVTRAIVDGIENTVERGRLRRTFAGQVSPAVMNEMLAGSLSPGVSGQLAEVCILFSDIRDFTTLSERMPPVVVTTVLQRYFDRMVHAVHRHEGTVDKFIGDGMMVLFGAPRQSDDPCGDAVKCALAMMSELDRLNGEFEAEGLPTLTIGIGINFGVVTVGNIGSSERHNYSAIGDAVNVAARLEGLTKELGRKILITEAVVSRSGQGFQFDPLGSHSVKGHSPVKIWGIRTARPAPAAT